MADPRPGDMTRNLVARNQHKHQIEELAIQIEHWAKQVRLDLKLDRLRADHARSAAQIAAEMYAEVRVLMKHDEDAAKAARLAPETGAVA